MTCGIQRSGQPSVGQLQTDPRSTPFSNQERNMATPTTPTSGGSDPFGTIAAGREAAAQIAEVTKADLKIRVLTENARAGKG